VSARRVWPTVEPLDSDWPAEAEGMFHPVRCTWCNTVYDSGPVTVIGRWSDCTAWIAPCCGRQVDDRQPPWTYRADVVELRRPERPKARRRSDWVNGR
jgi:hypothetical protein